jgi:hypothetical protein
MGHHVGVSPRRRRPHLGVLALAGCALGLLCFAVVLAVDAAPSAGDTTATDATTAAAGHQHVAGPAPEVRITDGDTRHELARQLAAARSAVKGINTAADARAHGYVPATVDLSYLGVHYVRPDYVGKPFDPAHPTNLIFDQDGPDGHLIGLMYYADSDGPPDGFAGPNDVWHTHAAACLSNGIILALDDITDSQCARLGGSLTPLSAVFAHRWMVHVWVVPGEKNPWGTFADGHPALA